MDPKRPKRPLSAYMVWLQEHRQYIKEKYKGINNKDLLRKAGALWRKVDNKSVWEEKARQLKLKYQKDLECYNSEIAKLSVSTRMDLSKETKQLDLNKGRKRRLESSPGRPSKRQRLE